MLPRFYKHLLLTPDALELLFVHRWILLCFKREFREEEALSMWEACWAHYQTDYFHLFICLAIISVYGALEYEKYRRCVIFYCGTLLQGKTSCRSASQQTTCCCTSAVSPCT